MNELTPISQSLKTQRQAILQRDQTDGAYHIIIFGSVARKDDNFAKF